jgi:hypothetical protein
MHQPSEGANALWFYPHKLARGGILRCVTIQTNASYNQQA